MNTAAHDPCEIVSTRWVRATPAQVFSLHEQLQRLTRWWGPDGFTSTFEAFDFRVGGEWRFSFHGPDGKDYPNHVVFREIERPARIALEHVAPHFTLSIDLQEEDGGTRVTWHQRFPTAAMREQFAPICVPSNEQNFNRLEAELQRMSPVARQIFVNLPIRDMTRSRDFFAALGFAFNPQFSNDQGACMVISEGIHAMLLVESFFKTFIDTEISDARRATEVLTCLSCESRAEVDDLVKKAVAAGGKAHRQPQDHGFMYGHGFVDPDGHIWELVYMDPNAAPPQA